MNSGSDPGCDGSPLSADDDDDDDADDGNPGLDVEPLGGGDGRGCFEITPRGIRREGAASEEGVFDLFTEEGDAAGRGGALGGGVAGEEEVGGVASGEE